MKVVNLGDHRPPGPRLDDAELVEALAEIDDLRERVARGEIHSLAWCALSADETRHYHAGSYNDFYRLIWGIGRLQADLDEHWGVDYEPD